MIRPSLGTTWHCNDPTTTVNGISGRSANSAYAVRYAAGGFASLMRWNGTGWATTTVGQLRHYGASNEQLATAAHNTGLVVDAHMLADYRTLTASTARNLVAIDWPRS
jgi:hypothetical protein